MKLRRMTLAEYRLRMDAAALRSADRMYELAVSAFFQRNVEQVRDNNVYEFQKVEDLYDLNKAERLIFGDSVDSAALKRLHEIYRRSIAWEEQNADGRRKNNV
ncbi:MAG: hypothetical protein SPJ59_02305 [Peptoniphilaceae bacterium]|nr:hypothetical protein [Peptoniphilaceae bacterium]MDY3987339.1 hypothetical protein [Peptoniphilaceae bacterium]MDY5765965.1 hypothetical protein [Peptoniphilaceae bacterium]MDY5841749.1 hypothetical protein [Peptoniphilaceae bacterium]